MRLLTACFVAATLVAVAPLSAQTEAERECGYQGAVISAIQKARLDKVKRDQVETHILAGETAWPEGYNVAIGHYIPMVYDQKMRDLKKGDLGEDFKGFCVANWDTVKR